MKFMIIVKASKASEAGEMPSTELLTAMGNYNEELSNAGILLAGEVNGGLSHKRPLSKLSLEAVCCLSQKSLLKNDYSFSLN